MHHIIGTITKWTTKPIPHALKMAGNYECIKDFWYGKPSRSNLNVPMSEKPLSDDNEGNIIKELTSSVGPTVDTI